MSKSYWQKMSVRSDHDRHAVLSWFAPLCDDMTVESAEILCDIATDREKKIKAVMVTANGVRKIATRTVGGKNVTMTLTPIRAKQSLATP